MIKENEDNDLKNFKGIEEEYEKLKKEKKKKEITENIDENQSTLEVFLG